MKITDIHIDGFGVWNDLHLERLSPHLTAFYGANEAGKTTLMQFSRAILYGMSPQRRSRYLPPVNGGMPGGTLSILDDGQQLEVRRIADRGPDDLGRVTITTQDGQATGDRLLREALSEIDESTFNNVFAIGLSEIQQLGTLSDTKAAELLYRLTSGLDRVSLYDVIQGLRQTRNDLLSAPDPVGKAVESKISQLMNRREVLKGEIKQLVQRNRRWSQLAVRIQELDEQIVEQEERVRAFEQQTRTLEIAVGLKPNWRKRAKVTAQLQQFSGTVQLPDDSVQRLDELQKKIERHQREADVLSGQRQQLKEESERLGINQRLMKNCCRIDALGEQRDWLQSLVRQIEDLEAEAEQFEQLLENEQERLGQALGLAEREHLQVISKADLEGLQPQIEELRAVQKQVEQAQAAFDSQTEHERSLKVKIETAIVGGERHGLPMDVREASDLVGKLRSRLKVEQRLDQTRSHELELEQQSHELLEEQVMPLSTFNWTLSAVVLGALLVGVWLIWPGSPLGSVGPLLALGGLATGIFCFLFKSFIENSAADKLEACQHQMDVVARQIKEAEHHKEQLDADLPMTDGSVLIRLQAAERHLTELENVLPVEAERKQAKHDASSAESRLAQAQAAFDKGLARWRTKLISLGFSEQLDPERLLSVTDRYSALGELEGRAKLRREDAAAREREHAMITRRIHDLAEEVDCLLESDETETGEDGEEYEVEVSTLEQLEHLLSQRRRQLADVERRDGLFERAKELKSAEAKHRRAIVGIRRRRDAIFHAADCDDEPAYRRLAEEQQKQQQLRKQRKSITREITAAIGQLASEETFAGLLSSEKIGELEAQWEAVSAKLEAAREELTTLAGERGALRQEQRAIAEDKSLDDRQLELSCAEKQLIDTCKAWREHATVTRVLERIRSEYEAHRQPETLAEASQAMSRLTDGEYRRVWTPLANDILLVENSAGESLTVDHLSRGTREQLFLSVRLAIVATFARRGIKLPLVLDDVLVNFDALRAQRAAEVLSEFAAGGHQVLLFTCHEHMWQMFKAIDADCRRLPSRGTVALPEPVIVAAAPVVVAEVPEPDTEPVPVPKPKKKRPKPKPQPVVETLVVEPEPEPALPDFYEYPFVEKIEQEVVQESRVETVYEWNSQQLPPTAQEHTLAYIVSEESQAAEQDPVFFDRTHRDHREPRRA